MGFQLEKVPTLAHFNAPEGGEMVFDTLYQPCKCRVTMKYASDGVDW